ncbi:MAG: Ig-like domain-containing protein, partial [Gemmatimonadota bacterium]
RREGLLLPLFIVVSFAGCKGTTGPRAVSMTITPPGDTINAVGYTTTLTAQVLDKDGRVLDQPITWHALDTGVATVVDGVVTAVAPGTARIEAAADGVSKTVLVVVRQVPATVTLTVPYDTIAVREAMPLAITVQDSNHIAIPDPAVAWTSSDTTVMTVAGDTVRGVGEGSSTVTATVESASASVSLTAELMIAFVTDRSGTPRIMEIGRTGGPIRMLVERQPAYSPKWSADGSTLAFVSGGSAGGDHLFVMHADGTGERELDTGASRETAPSWSPDGTKLAFVSRRDGDADIFVVNRDGTGLLRLTDDTMSDDAPAWSPDGTRIAFQSDRFGLQDIFLMNPDGTDQTDLTNDPGNFQMYPDWSPDGTKILCLGLPAVEPTGRRTGLVT